MFRKQHILSLMLCLIFTGCSMTAGRTPSSSGGAEGSASSAEAWLPAPEWGEQVYMTAFAVEGREEPVFSPEYRLPLIENASGIPSYEAINAYYAQFLSELKIASSELAGWAVDDYKTSLISKTPFYKYVDTEEFEIAFQSNGFLSVLRSHYSNAGGPSPILYPVGDTFDLTTGARLTFAALFTCPEKTASDRVLQAILEQNAQGTYRNMVIDEEQLCSYYQPEQFYLTEEALTVYYPEGDLAGVIGSPTFAVPYEELEDIWALWD